MKYIYFLLIFLLTCVAFRDDKAVATIWVYDEENTYRVRSEFYIDPELAGTLIRDHFKAILEYKDSVTTNPVRKQYKN